MIELLTYLKGFSGSNKPQRLATKYVHTDYWGRFTDTICHSTTPAPAQNLRPSAAVSFGWRNCCFSCSSRVGFRHKESKKLRRVITINIKDDILLATEQYKDDRGGDI